MKAEIGKYHFGRRFNYWVIWQRETLYSSTRIKDVETYEDAVREVYRLNGWGEPKAIKKNF